MASCADAYKPFDEGDGDVPTATGNPASVGDVVFVGELTRTALSGISETEAESGTAPATLRVAPDSPDNFGLEIKESKINTGFLGVLYGIQLLSNSDTKVVEASGESTDPDAGITTKEYIKITLDDALNPTTATVIYQMSSSGGEGFPTMSAKYEGTLNKVTSSGS